MAEQYARIDPSSDLVVMVVTDGSDESNRAIARIPNLIAVAGRWEIATVIDDAPDPGSGANGFASPVLSPDEVDEIATGEQMAGDAATASAARALGPIPVHRRVVRGTNDDVAAHADRVGADVIVVAADPASGGGFLSVSVAGELHAVTHIPVLVIPS